MSPFSLFLSLSLSLASSLFCDLSQHWKGTEFLPLHLPPRPISSPRKTVNVDPHKLQDKIIQHHHGLIIIPPDDSIMTTIDPKDTNHASYHDLYPSSPPYPHTIAYYDTAHFLQPRNDQFFPGEPSDHSVRDQRLSLTLGSEIQMPPLHYEIHNLAVNVSGSRYLKSTQELLDEVVNVRPLPKKNRSEQKSTLEEPSLNHPHEREDLQNKLAKLMSMVDQVDRKYTNYRQQMQIIVSSFDSVVGPGAAKSYTELVLKTISRQFRILRDAINGQISSTRRILGEDEPSSVRSVARLRSIDQRVFQPFNSGQQAWRPQRGLPETSVSILRAWLFEHFLHPYPKDSDKMMLASQTGLTRSQVSNWFINARVRLWKPMIEEMYEQELREAETRSTENADECGEVFQEQVPAQTRDGQREIPVRLTLGLRNSVGGPRASVDGNAADEYKGLNMVDRRHSFGSVPMLHDFVA